jgi:hypothetical protein
MNYPPSAIRHLSSTFIRVPLPEDLLFEFEGVVGYNNINKYARI